MSHKDDDERNKLIAEFMGYKYHPHPEKDSGWRKEKGHMKLQGYYLCRRHKDLLYRYSFDWVMPVVEKIESIQDPHHGYFGVHISSNNCTIQATNLRPDKPMADPPHYFSDHYGESKIEATWLAIVNFITWFNKGMTFNCATQR